MNLLSTLVVIAVFFLEKSRYWITSKFCNCCCIQCSHLERNTPSLMHVGRHWSRLLAFAPSLKPEFCRTSFPCWRIRRDWTKSGCTSGCSSNGVTLTPPSTVKSSRLTGLFLVCTLTFRTHLLSRQDSSSTVSHKILYKSVEVLINLSKHLFISSHISWSIAIRFITSSREIGFSPKDYPSGLGIIVGLGLSAKIHN